MVVVYLAKPLKFDDFSVFTDGEVSLTKLLPGAGPFVPSTEIRDLAIYKEGFAANANSNDPSTFLSTQQTFESAYFIGTVDKKDKTFLLKPKAEYSCQAAMKSQSAPVSITEAWRSTVFMSGFNAAIAAVGSGLKIPVNPPALVGSGQPAETRIAELSGLAINLKKTRDSSYPSARPSK